MNRVEKSEAVIKELYQENEIALKNTDKDFYDIKTRLIYGEVYQDINLSPKMRELILLVVATTNMAIKEALYHSGAYIGLSKAQNAIEGANEVFKELGIKSIVSQKTVTEESRLQDGINAQKAIFGGSIDTMRANAPENQKNIQDYLTAYCFGDFYTRNSLNLQERELLTFCILAAQGGCEAQVQAHVQGNLNMGNDKQVMLDALTLCIPYIGFPRTLNALAVLNKVISE